MYLTANGHSPEEILEKDSKTVLERLHELVPLMGQGQAISTIAYKDLPGWDIFVSINCTSAHYMDVEAAYQRHTVPTVKVWDSGKEEISFFVRYIAHECQYCGCHTNTFPCPTCGAY